MDTFNRVKKVLAKALSISEEEITPEAAIVDDLGADSLAMVEVFARIEKEFGIAVGDDSTESDPLNPLNLSARTTVQQLVDTIQAHLEHSLPGVRSLNATLDNAGHS